MARFKRKAFPIPSCFHRRQRSPVPKESNPIVKKKKSNGNGRLTANQKIFADQWLVDRNGTRAYKVSYPNVKKDETAGVCAFELLRLPKVAEYISKKLDKLSADAEIDTEWVLQRYKMLSDYSIDDFYNDDGAMKPLSEIPKEKLYAIGGFKHSRKIITLADEVRIVDRIKEFKLPEKKGVLDSIGKYLGMFKEDNEQRRPLIPVQINVGLTD